MDNQLNIKLVRLQSGEDVIAGISSDSELTTLNNPMVIMVQRSPKGSVMMMVPWLPIELICDNMATLNNRDIITFTNPRKSLIEYYLNAIKTVAIEASNAEHVIQDFNSRVQGEFNRNMPTRGEIEDYYNDDAPTMNDYFDNMNTSDKSKLH